MRHGLRRSRVAIHGFAEAEPRHRPGNRVARRPTQCPLRCQSTHHPQFCPPPPASIGQLQQDF